ncbi:acyl-CoA dehydrogenase family protein [Streptomyces aureocirculatus]|uniref:acyl-CoA dehydrogenase family protein n=1 Tax=Streptomyces aureocirculatus TaxID=67275 RepID=UPI0004CA635E|nr:acyl-CoA dehydrogenase family protein [Streptomyces aureocirculatus]
MDFQPSDDQRALRRGIREVMEGRFGRDALRAAVEAPALDRELWRALGDAGFFALCVPEDAGGVGLGLPEAVLAFEEAGRVLLPGPAVATFLAAGDVEGAAAGETVVTAVEGELVPWLEEADVVRGDTDGAVPVRSVDPLTPLHRVPDAPNTSHDPHDPHDPYTPHDPHAPRTSAHVASLLRAAEQLGSATRTCESAVEHARTREQFGGPVGRFQAVQHLCADMLVRAELARVAVYAAAVTGDRLAAAGARLLADDAAVRNARDCLQVHGGMGFTWESDVHLHLKRAWVRAGLGAGARQAEEDLAAAL